ncbi:MAG: hypothetical protein ACRC57_11625 [Sarcina sp.]
MDILEKIKKINYTFEEIKNLEEKILFNDKGVGLESNYIEDEYKIRIKTYNNMLEKVEKNLCNNEYIKIGKINIPHSSGSGGIDIVLYYQGIFFTNKRIFIFNMNFKYEQIEDLIIKDLKEISILRENTEWESIRIEFNNKERVVLKGYSNSEKELILVIVKFLLEEGIKFSNSNKIIEKLFF